MLAILLLAALMSFVAAQPVPLPNFNLGFRIGDITAPVQISAVFDLLCPDCAAAYPVLLQVGQHFGPSKVSIVVTPTCLPYHTFSFTAAQGLYTIQSLNSTDQAGIDYFNLIFAHQNDNNDFLYSPNTTQTQVINWLAELVETNLGYPQSAFIAGMNNDNINENARVAFKWASSRYTTGTPNFMINDLPAWSYLGDGTLQDWISVIQPLLSTSEHVSIKSDLPVC